MKTDGGFRLDKVAATDSCKLTNAVGYKAGGGCSNRLSQKLKSVLTKNYIIYIEKIIVLMLFIPDKGSL